MKVEPLILSQLILITILLLSIICPWQNIKFTGIEEIQGMNVTIIKDIRHSIYHKSIIYLNLDYGDGDKEPMEYNTSEFDSFGDIKFMLFTILSLSLIILVLYIFVIKSIMKHNSNNINYPLIFELLAHSIPIVIIILTITLSFIATDLTVIVCNNRYSLDPYQLQQQANCFELKVENSIIPLYNIESNQQTATINSTPLIGYHLLLISVLASIILSIIHIIRYDNLKQSSPTNKKYTLLSTSSTFIV